VAADYVDKISKGSIPPKITGNYNGDFNEIKNNLNSCIDSLSGLIAEMKQMSDEHNLGEIDKVIPTDKFEGAYRTMARCQRHGGRTYFRQEEGHGLCGRVRQGKLRCSIGEVPGKKAFINETIEQVRSNLKALIADTGTLVEAAASVG